MELDSPLRGRTIAVPETRELDVFSGLLERRGATVVRCPLVAIHDAHDPAPVLAWVDRAVAGQFQDVIFLTGEGLRRIVSCIDRNNAGIRAQFIAALARMRKITRGPKPARALKELGLQSDLAAEMPTTEGVIALLKQYDLRDRTVAVQLYGSDPNERLVNFLRDAGARVDTVAPYIYADKSEESAVHALADRINRGEIDAMAFTSLQQVNRLFDVLGENANRILAKTIVAAVGPVVGDALAKRGVQVALMPTDSYFLKPLTRSLEERFAAR